MTERLAADLPEQGTLLIAGAYRASRDGGSFDSINPSTGAVVATFAEGTKAAVDDAVSAAARR